MFNELKKQLSSNFLRMAEGPLFYIDVDRDEVWQAYLAGFADDLLRQEHNCNGCKSFIRQFAGVVSIEGNEVVSIWDNLTPPDEYVGPVKNLVDYIHSLAVTDVFLTPLQKAGTDRNRDAKRGVTWEHFYIEIPGRFVRADADAARGPMRDDKNVLQRSLEELTVDATETVLELVAQNSLYKGKEHEGLLKKFLALQKEYAGLPPYQKVNFCWAKSVGAGALARIRNTAIGTLLIDLSGGTELDHAVTKYERVVAPTNYKRPSALVTPKMVAQAKETLAGLGLLESLDRRLATEADLNVNDVLFLDRPVAATDVFAEVSREAIINPRTFSKVEEIGIASFVEHVLPTARTVHVLFENSHLDNLVTLVTAKNDAGPTLFKWPNRFSWSYTGGITDSIKELVKRAGGNVDGELRVSLSWRNYDDLDLHAFEPGGTHIYFRNKGVRHPSSGMLDVDMNAGSGQTRSPVENMIWVDKNKIPEGRHKIQVHNYCQRERTNVGFTVQVECRGEVYNFEFPATPRHQEYQPVVEYTYSRLRGIQLEGEVKSNVVSREKWGIGTNRFHKVTRLMLSPNHWGGAGVGNKHYFFIIEDCLTDEQTRPFFNEFLKPEMDKHRKVFEVLGSKVKVEEARDQLSGLGFSETKRAQLIVRVDGRTSRALKINF